MFSDMLRQQHWRLKFSPVWWARSYQIIQSKVNLKLEVCNTDNDLIDHLFTKKLRKKLINKRCHQKAKRCYKKAKKYFFHAGSFKKIIHNATLLCFKKLFFSIVTETDEHIFQPYYLPHSMPLVSFYTSDFLMFSGATERE